MFDEEEETPQQKAIREIRERRLAERGRRRAPASRLQIMLVFILLCGLGYYLLYMTP